MLKLSSGDQLFDIWEVYGGRWGRGGGVCWDQRTSVLRFGVAPAVDENPSDDGGDDHHQAHGDQDDQDGTQTIHLRWYGGIHPLLCGWNGTAVSHARTFRCYSVVI